MSRMLTGVKNTASTILVINNDTGDNNRLQYFYIFLN